MDENLGALGYNGITFLKFKCVHLAKSCAQPIEKMLSRGGTWTEIPWLQGLFQGPELLGELCCFLFWIFCGSIFLPVSLLVAAFWSWNLSFSLEHL